MSRTWVSGCSDGIRGSGRWGRGKEEQAPKPAAGCSRTPSLAAEPTGRHMPGVLCPQVLCQPYGGQPYGGVCVCVQEWKCSCVSHRARLGWVSTGNHINFSAVFPQTMTISCRAQTRGEPTEWAQSWLTALCSGTRLGSWAWESGLLPQVHCGTQTSLLVL